MRANADNPEDAARARAFGAEGIGLCRTEHMFFGEDRESLVKEMFLAAERWRRALLHDAGPSGDGDDRHAAERDFASPSTLGALQRRDFAGIFRAMTGMPVTIRLLDPPLHEFLPVDHFEAELERSLRTPPKPSSSAPGCGSRWHRTSARPTRCWGCAGAPRDPLPPLYEMQVRAIVGAALEVAGRATPRARDHAAADRLRAELAALREVVESGGERGDERRRRDVEYHVGTMIELPRACLIAGRIATHADFFSFGTNDLTQTAIGFSRDDVEARLSDHLPEPRVDRREPVRDDRRAGSGRADAARGRARAGAPTRRSGSAYAASTAGTRRASSSSNGSGSTTSAARPTGSRHVERRLEWRRTERETKRHVRIEVIACRVGPRRPIGPGEAG